MTQVTCQNCGGQLSPPLAKREVKCAYCGATQANPSPLPVLQEVFVPGSSGAFALARVVRCQGPDHIEVNSEDAVASVLPLEQLVPVERITVETKANTEVYLEQTGRWEPTWLVKVHGETCTVKSPTAGFQDSFFDKKVAVGSVRVVALPERRARRTSFQAWWAKCRANPVETVFGGCFKIVVFSFMAVVAAMFGYFLLRMWGHC